MSTVAGSRKSAVQREPNGSDFARTEPPGDIGPRREFELVVTDGEWMGRRVVLSDAPVILGRSAEADLQIRDLTVSRHHCVIWRADGRCWVRDLGSVNHTRVNNRLVSVAELFEGDVVIVGGTALTLASERHIGEVAQLPAGTPA